MKILVIEDSTRLRRSLEHGLRREGFDVDLAADGEVGYQYAKANEYDVLVLDLMLPKLPGLDVLQRLRREGRNCAVLILSAKDQIEDRVTGLEMGADDYLVKPFAFDELCARIRALGRRQQEIKIPDIDLGCIHIDTSKREVGCADQIIALTPSEYHLLECLATHRGVVMTKHRLREWLYDSNADASSNVVEVLVSSLRKKLRKVGAESVVKTRHGFGYLIE